MDGKGFSHLSNVGVGTGNSEFIRIGVGEKVVGLGICGGKEDSQRLVLLLRGERSLLE